MISVVIPLYNKEISIKQTIMSVLSQTMTEFELIVVDDGSSDNSLHVVREFKDSRIRVFSKTNGGVSSARNYGIERAKFSWVALLDGDDLWLKNHLESLLRIASNFPKCQVVSTSFSVDEPPSIIENHSVEVVSNYFELAYELAKRNEVVLHSSTVMIKRDCFESEKFNINYALGEDRDFWCRLAKKYNIAKSFVRTVIYKTETENHSESKKSPINKWYLQSDYSNMGKFERKYHLNSNFWAFEYFFERKMYADSIELLRRSGAYSIILVQRLLVFYFRRFCGSLGLVKILRKRLK